jgi:hypothetical protein
MMEHDWSHIETRKRTSLWIIERKIEGKRAEGRPRTSFVKQLIFDTGLSSYKELKRLGGDGKEWRARVRLRNQP